MIKISRPNYDKIRRCPGWSGPGMGGKELTDCPGTVLNPDCFASNDWRRRIVQCPNCKLWILPYNTRYFDPAVWLYAAEDHKRRFDWWWYFVRLRAKQDKEREGFSYNWREWLEVMWDEAKIQW